LVLTSVPFPKFPLFFSRSFEAVFWSNPLFQLPPPTLAPAGNILCVVSVPLRPSIFCTNFFHGLAFCSFPPCPKPSWNELFDPSFFLCLLHKSPPPKRRGLPLFLRFSLAPPDGLGCVSIVAIFRRFLLRSPFQPFGSRGFSPIFTKTASLIFFSGLNFSHFLPPRSSLLPVCHQPFNFSRWIDP